MRKITSILAAVVVSMSIFSCEADTNTAEDNKLYETIAGNDNNSAPDDGSGD